ncbi:pilus assembly protein [Olsenella uli]|uniref:TadE/TadG family type IV pilus assembly protein n=1 Tax=Olsenella uli TaxID=133926 RepID=UPI00195E6B10|nr:pilus assembly protein [Olsenella uli]MBM6675721.1 pilus assembly protein [Olsenella uli]
MGGGRGRSGQMSVEAALLLPVALTLVALLAQPACVLYTRTVMAATAGELARLAATSRGTEGDLRSFALRRLAAVPDLSIFHEGGPADWEIEVTGPDDGGRVTVALEGRVRPLPLFGALVSALGTAVDGTVVVRVETSGDMRADWIGGGYEDWIGMWG